MESNTSPPPLDNADARTAFRKPSHDTSARQYRRRSPVGGSSSSDDSPKRDYREDPARKSSSWRRKDDEKELDRDSGRNHHGRSGDAYKKSDQQPSRSSFDYHRRDSHTRRDKYMDDEERHYRKSLSHSSRESRSRTHSENDHYKSRHHSHSDDKYSRDRSDGSGHRGADKDRDERKDYRRGDCRSDRSPVYEDPRGHRNDSGSQRDRAGHRLSEMSKSESKELDGQKYAKEEKRKLIDQETNREKDQYDRQPGERFKEKSVLNSGEEDSPAKRRKSFVLGTDYEEEKSPKLAHEPAAKVNPDQASLSGCTAADIDAAKIAAMKAADIVNKNLIGTGYMSADQKKKLLWGNKKSTSAEEQSGHRWDTAAFSDREQQEKFKKLMSLRLRWYIWPIVGCEGRHESGSQIQQPREQWAPCREAEGGAAGLGKAIHCWASSKGWAYRGTRSVTPIPLGCFCTCELTFRSNFLYLQKTWYFEFIDYWHVEDNDALLILSDTLYLVNRCSCDSCLI